MKTKQVVKKTRKINTLDSLGQIFAEATKEVLEANTNVEITYSPTLIIIPQIHLKPEIGCFVQFNGDYHGLMIMNFSGDAAMAIYRRSMMSMGLPEEDLATEFTSDEIVDSIGEMINQIIGKTRQIIEAQYGLTAFNSQPKAIALTNSIVLYVDSVTVDKNSCRRIAFKIDRKSFQIELSMENAEFVSMTGENVHDRERRDVAAAPNMEFEAMRDLM